MKAFPMAVALFAALLTSQSTAQPIAPQPILPESLQWFGPPDNPALKGAWVLGAEKDAGPYILRVMLAKDGKIPSHRHPDTRYTTVLSGTLYVGFGDAFDESKLVIVPAGGVYVAPANVSHFLWAKEGDVTYQESGVGPTGTIPVKP
ncbi:MAG TPA: cupin domain-containing protein [Candidatus Competibacteraceae bacterium]|nr:cupin domain-containing protein [Candidatus Competibacteraceae bacterium]